MSNVLTFDVGQAERHRVELSFERMLGGLTIKVDGQLVESDRNLVSFRLTRRYEFTVGQAERHAVAIEKKRKLLLAGFRPSLYQVFVDGQQVLSREL